LELQPSNDKLDKILVKFQNPKLMTPKSQFGVAHQSHRGHKSKFQFINSALWEWKWKYKWWPPQHCSFWMPKWLKCLKWLRATEQNLIRNASKCRELKLMHFAFRWLPRIAKDVIQAEKFPIKVVCMCECKSVAHCIFGLLTFCLEIGLCRAHTLSFRCPRNPNQPNTYPHVYRAYIYIYIYV